jgi:hypothetical protein
MRDFLRSVTKKDIMLFLHVLAPLFEVETSFYRRSSHACYTKSLHF